MKKILSLVVAVVSLGGVQAESRYFGCIPMKMLMEIADLNSSSTSGMFSLGTAKNNVICERITPNTKGELELVSKSQTINQGGNSTTIQYKPSSSKSNKYGVLVCHIAERYFGHRRGIRGLELDPNRSHLNYNNMVVIDFGSLNSPENDKFCIHYRTSKRNRFGHKSPFGRFRLLQSPIVLVRNLLNEESSRYSLKMVQGNEKDGKTYTLTNGADPYESFLRKK